MPLERPSAALALLRELRGNARPPRMAGGAHDHLTPLVTDDELDAQRV